MYIIVTYDLKSESNNHRDVFNLLAKHLHHTQNSVFEGEITESKLTRIIKELNTIIKSNDSLQIYKFNYKIDTIYIGKQKNTMSNIL
jgi:CRISPR-associated protein Cas2